MLLLSKNKPKYEYFVAPKNPVSALIRSLVTHKYFTFFSGGCVLINVLFMVADHQDPPAWFASLVEQQVRRAAWVLACALLCVRSCTCAPWCS
jgi:hypothetical protein